MLRGALRMRRRLRRRLNVPVGSLPLRVLSALYLDYSNNAYLQNYVGRTTTAILSGINVWTGVILGVTSFLATYFLLQDSSKPKGAGGATNRLRQWAGKMRIRPRKISKIVPTVSGIIPGLPSME